MSLLDLLTEGRVTEFNETRGERSKVELFAADLAGKELMGVDLSGADVEKADLTGADLTRAGLYKARLSGIDGSEMKLVECLGARIKLREAWLDQADLTGSDFANGDFTEAVLTKTRGDGLRLASAKLKEVDAKGAVWPDSDLAGAHLGKSDFTGADLCRADLTEASGGEVVAVGVKLDAATLDSARLPGIDLTKASLVGASLKGADLGEANFTDADLRGADLSGANLSRAIFAGADLTGCVLADTSLDGVDLTGLVLSDVDLTGHDADLLGLSDDQRDQILTVGIPVNPDATLKPTDVRAAAHGDLVVALWENDDGEGMTTLRFIARMGSKTRDGIVPVTASSIISKDIVSTGSGIAIVLLRDRPSGITVDRYRIGADGKLAASVSSALGYKPTVPPVLSADGQGFRMWGLARRGPTLVISAHGEEGFGPVASKPLTTARGFLGTHHPFLACKGNVLMACSRTGVDGPKKSPEGYPGKLATGAPGPGEWFVAWVEEPAGREPGGLRGAYLVNRGAPEVLPLTHNGAVLSLDAVSYDNRVHLAWVEMHGLGDTRVFTATVEPEQDGPLKARAVAAEDVDHVTFALDATGAPRLVMTTDGESVQFARL